MSGLSLANSSSSRFSFYNIKTRRNNRIMFLLCSIVFLSIKNIGNKMLTVLYPATFHIYLYWLDIFCNGLMSTRLSLRVISESFSFININRPYNPLNRNILFANARNIDVGYGCNNVFAKVSYHN